MSVNTTTNRISYTGDGTSTAFAFPFKILDAAHLLVYINGVVQGYLSGYSVSGVNNANGGTVTFFVAPTAGTAIIILRVLPLTQPVTTVDNSTILQSVLDTALDRATMQIQQIGDGSARAIRVPDTEPLGFYMTLPDAASRANKALIFDNLGNVTISPTNYVDQVLLTQTYANNAASSAALASSSAASALSSFTSFRGIYYGAFAADPSLDPNGNAPTTGDFYFNTSTLVLRVFTGTGWNDTVTPTPTSYFTQLFSGTGAQTTFTLSGTPASLAALEVFVSGARQRPTTDYSFGGTTLTFVAAPASGTNNILVRWTSAASVGVPNDGAVSTAKIQDAAVTNAKLADDAVTTSKIFAASVTTAKLADAAVTYAKIQNVSATSRVLGRATAGAGVLEELTLTQILDFIGFPTRGDILYRGASAWQRLPAGTVGQFLQTQGASLDPVWAAAGNNLNVTTYTSGSGTWTKPSTGTFARVRLWAAGGSGYKNTGTASNTTAGGGSGGGYIDHLYRLADLPATVSYGIGAGGAAVTATSNTSGNPGGNTTFGSLIAYGGAGGTQNNVSGGGLLSTGGTAQTNGATSDAANPWDGGQGGDASTGNKGPGKAFYGGGGGGGAGNGSTISVTSAGGTSVFGGAGGAGNSTSGGTAVNGSAPGGGGGGKANGASGASGAGADGRIEIWVW